MRMLIAKFSFATWSSVIAIESWSSPESPSGGGGVLATNAPGWLYAIAVVFLIAFGFVQFNRWTDNELKADDILSAAPPKHFTSFSRFCTMASLYCISLIAFYAVLVAIFLHEEWGKGYLEVSGVTPANAWLAGLFVITGFSSVVPPFTNMESIVRETLHRWAFVPMKAKSLASQISDQSTKFRLEKTHVDKALSHAGAGFLETDFVVGATEHIANKWCRLVYLLNRFAPYSGRGVRQWPTNSPYVSKFNESFGKLQKRLQDLALAKDPVLREVPVPPQGIDIADRVDRAIEELYLLMSCQALGSKMSWDAVRGHFSSVYGIDVAAPSGVSLPSTKIFNSLALVAVAAFATSGLYKLITQDEVVSPHVWAAAALATHGLGVVAGLLTFSFQLRGERDFSFGQHRGEFRGDYFAFAIILGYAFALFPTWLATVHYLKLAQGISVMEAGFPALLVGWPWAFLGSATAIAILGYLEYTVDREVSLRTRIVSGTGQAVLNITLSLCIIAAQTLGGPVAPNADLADSFRTALADPTYQLVIVLTGLIGLLLGLTMPAALRGWGREKRIATRESVPEDLSDVSLAIRGVPSSGKMLDMSTTGARVRVDSSREIPRSRQFGWITLKSGLRLPAQLARLIEEDASRADVGIWFSTDSRSFQLDKRLQKRVADFMKQFCS